MFRRVYDVSLSGSDTMVSLVFSLLLFKVVRGKLKIRLSLIEQERERERERKRRNNYSKRERERERDRERERERERKGTITVISKGELILIMHQKTYRRK